MAIERVPTLDSEGKIKPAFWPDVVSDLSANVAAAVGTAVDALVPGLVDTAVADAVGEELAVKADAYPEQNHQTGTSYTFGIADAKRITLADNPAASTFTIPRQADVAWLAETAIPVANLGAGLLTIAAGSGVTLVNPAAVTLALGESATLLRLGTNTWIAVKGGGAGPKGLASGGTESDITDGGVAYRLLDFTSNGTLVVTTAGHFEFELRGASGASGAADGGSWAGSASGAGGYLRISVWLAVGTYTITVPAGPTSGNGGAAKVTGPGITLYVPGGGRGGQSNGNGLQGASNGHPNPGAALVEGTYGNQAGASNGGGAGGTTGAGVVTTFRGITETVCKGGGPSPGNNGNAVANSGNGVAGVPTFTPSPRAGSSGYVGCRFEK